jgi:hypothetical protein
MPIPMKCECGLSLEAPDSREGKTIRCPSCRRELDVPFVNVIPLDGGPAPNAPGRGLTSDEDDMPMPVADAKERDRRREVSQKRNPMRRRRGPLFAFEEGWLGDINGGVAAGALTMVVAAIWGIIILILGGIPIGAMVLFGFGFFSLIFGLNQGGS